MQVRRCGGGVIAGLWGEVVRECGLMHREGREATCNYSRELYSWGTRNGDKEALVQTL